VRPRIVACVAALALCIVIAGLAWSQQEHPKASAATPEMKTIQGEVLDMMCYMAHEGKGPKHKKCAETCISEGAPMGLLTSDGSVYLLVGDHAAPDAYASLKTKAAEQVKVSGDVMHRGGVQAVVVKSVAAVK